MIHWCEISKETKGHLVKQLTNHAFEQYISLGKPNILVNYYLMNI